MPHAIAPHAPVSSHRFPMPIAARFSRGGARENRVIQPQLVEIFAVFGTGVGGEKWGVLFAVLGGDASGFIHSPSGLARGGALSKPCRFACSGAQKERTAVALRSPSARQAQGERFNRKLVLARASLGVMIEARFSHDPARGNRAIQPQLVEISAIFWDGCGWSTPHPFGLSLSKPCLSLFNDRKSKNSR
jgi:hypothetical protein